MTDEKTGIRFRKFTTLSGPNDVVDGSRNEEISPNGKFLLYGGRVIPLDGGGAFDLMDIDDWASGRWSPDGNKVVLYCGAMWLVEVDPETARPLGLAKRLLDRGYPPHLSARWSFDSTSIVFLRQDESVDRGKVSTLSITNGAMSTVADPFSLGLVSRPMERRWPVLRAKVLATRTLFW